jgi:hypothetical protein
MSSSWKNSDPKPASANHRDLALLQDALMDEKAKQLRNETCEKRDVRGATAISDSSNLARSPDQEAFSSLIAPTGRNREEMMAF